MDNIDDMLDPHQYGSGTTTLALAEPLHGYRWLSTVETPGTYVRILLLDFRKAFDSVNHKIIHTKLANTCLPDFLIKLVTSFLCEREQ